MYNCEKIDENWTKTVSWFYIGEVDDSDVDLLGVKLICGISTGQSYDNDVLFNPNLTFNFYGEDNPTIYSTKSVYDNQAKITFSMHNENSSPSFVDLDFTNFYLKSPYDIEKDGNKYTAVAYSNAMDDLMKTTEKLIEYDGRLSTSTRLDFLVDDISKFLDVDIVLGDGITTDDEHTWFSGTEIAACKTVKDLIQMITKKINGFAFINHFYYNIIIDKFTAPVETYEDDVISATFQSKVNTINGVDYSCGTVTIVGDFRLQPGDVVKVIYKGNIYIIPCLQIEHTYTGGFITTIYSPYIEKDELPTGNLTERTEQNEQNIQDALARIEALENETATVQDLDNEKATEYVTTGGDICRFEMCEDGIKASYQKLISKGEYETTSALEIKDGVIYLTGDVYLNDHKLGG